MMTHRRHRLRRIVARRSAGRQALCLLPACVLAAVGLTMAQAPPQMPSPVSSGTTARTLDCGRCHYCANPTTAERCLRDPCIRHLRLRQPDDFGPNVVILDALSRDYLPVPFDHDGHARMAAMGSGCATCHHHTPTGERPPACAACHDPTVEGTDPRKPGLKGAYHQQCLNCHREWIDETACEICHLPRSGRTVRAGASGFPTTDEIIKRIHPPIAQPAGELYAGSGETDGPVIFRHAQHVDRFGLACVECHHEPSCARCHTESNGARIAPTLVEHHRPCVRCHKDDMDLAGRNAGHCERCHWREGAPQPGLFDHTAVGWELGRFHGELPCRACHMEVPFERLDSRCEICHVDWSPATFDHRVTGQALDENHISIDCAICHRVRRFDGPPVCDDCHSDEEKPIGFPARRPGDPVAPKQ